MLGTLDDVSGGFVFGWAADAETPQVPVDVDLFIDDEWVMTARAELLRSDLVDGGIGDGRHGFAFDIPLRFMDGRSHVIAVRRGDTEEPVQRSPCTVVLGAAPEAELSDRLESLVLQVDRPLAQVLEKVRATRRLVLMASFQLRPRLLAYHGALVRPMVALGFPVILVQNVEAADGPASPGLGTDVDLLVLRRNVGFDFSAWLTVLEMVQPVLPHVDELVLMNDSVFGPLFALEPLFARMSTRPLDAWGITDSWDHTYHLQSYFLVLRRRALQSEAFARFLQTYAHPRAKANVVARGELALTQTLVSAGLAVGAACPYEQVAKTWLEGLDARIEHQATEAGVEHCLVLADRIRRGIPLNPSHAFWDTLVEPFGCPFLKRDLLFANSTGVPNLSEVPALLHRCGYPAEHIDEARRHGPAKLAPAVTVEPGSASVRAPASVARRMGQPPRLRRRP